MPAPPLENGRSAAFIADADGTRIRQLPIETTDLVDFEGLRWSPDGTRLSFMSSGRIGGTTMRWQRSSNWIGSRRHTIRPDSTLPSNRTSSIKPAI